MPSICKKHGKPRTVIIESKQGRNRRPLVFVGCEDCAKQRTEAKPEPAKPKPEAKPVKDEPEPIKKTEKKTLGQRFGFKF